MKQTYYIYHPINGELNYNCQQDEFEYEKVAVVQAVNLNDAFLLSQNDFNEEYCKLERRSTSIGDIIQSKDEFETTGKCHLVKNLGFSIANDNEWLFEDDNSFVEEEIDYFQNLDDVENDCALNNLESETYEK